MNILFRSRLFGGQIGAGAVRNGSGEHYGPTSRWLGDFLLQMIGRIILLLPMASSSSLLDHLPPSSQDGPPR